MKIVKTCFRNKNKNVNYVMLNGYTINANEATLWNSLVIQWRESPNFYVA